MIGRDALTFLLVACAFAPLGSLGGFGCGRDALDPTVFAGQDWCDDIVRAEIDARDDLRWVLSRERLGPGQSLELAEGFARDGSGRVRARWRRVRYEPRSPASAPSRDVLVGTTLTRGPQPKTWVERPARFERGCS